MAGGGSNFDSDDGFSSINVTPLVDVVLVLLVIFMITAPTLYQQSLKVQLPQATTGEGQTKDLLTVSISALGILNVNDKTISLDELREFVELSHPIAALILADKKTEHGYVISVLDTLKATGIHKFSFGVEGTAKK